MFLNRCPHELHTIYIAFELSGMQHALGERIIFITHCKQRTIIDDIMLVEVMRSFSEAVRKIPGTVFAR